MMNNNFKKTTRGDVWEKTILSKTAKERLWRHKSYKKTIDKSLCRLGFNPRNKTVLEIGCSDGALSRFLFPKSKLSGLDNDKRLFSKFKNQDYTFICGNLLDYPFKGNCFDIVCSFGLIEHLPNPKEAFQKHIDLVKPGGLILLSVPRHIWTYLWGVRLYSYWKNLSKIELQGKIFKLKEVQQLFSHEILEFPQIIPIYPTAWLQGINLPFNNKFFKLLNSSFMQRHFGIMWLFSARKKYPK